MLPVRRLRCRGPRGTSESRGRGWGSWRSKSVLHPLPAPRRESLPRPSVQRRKQRLGGSSLPRPHSPRWGGGPWVTLWLGVTTVGGRTWGAVGRAGARPRAANAPRALLSRSGSCPGLHSCSSVPLGALAPGQFPAARPPRDRAPSHRAVTASESQPGAAPATRYSPGAGRQAWASVSPCLRGRGSYG